MSITFIRVIRRPLLDGVVIIPPKRCHHGYCHGMNILMTAEVLSTECIVPVYISEVQTVTAQFALYEEKDDPEGILHWGIIEEAAECAKEMGLSDQENTENLASELGDMAWYASEKARFENQTLVAFDGGGEMTLDEFQAYAVRQHEDDSAEQSFISPIQDDQGNIIDPASAPEAVMSVLALRVVDAQTRTDDRLWHGDAQALTPARTIQDLFAFVAVTAHRHELKLSDVVGQMVDKLSNRPRKPHIMEYEDAREITGPELTSTAARREAVLPTLRYLALLGRL